MQSIIFFNLFICIHKGGSYGATKRYALNLTDNIYLAGCVCLMNQITRVILELSIYFKA
ncbi:hypothetical protein A1OE_1289 [Candidatus Endolissoclinum faulkneri L2]|uniref:Uncharacterized protein n=1 Tax=Candidatus Endolissoclinum faulkneri L2 TaxID=1193729 RepID=K7YPM9_9PROT|nr:hypothetical protein A1OE_1289 [Candidatus Endolissoclinum faulkneri L2]